MELIELIVRDVEEIGLSLKDSLIDKQFSVRSKTTPSDIVSDLDINAEQLLTNALRSFFPETPILSEEMNASVLSARPERSHIYIDPIDGSHNALLGSPLFGMTIAMYTNTNHIEWAVLHMPQLQWTIARKGHALGNVEDVHLSVNMPSAVKRVPELHHDYRIALISGYGTPVELSTDVLQQLARAGVTRIMQNWCPTFDYMLLMQDRIDACIVIDDAPFNTETGRWICEQVGKKTNQLNIVWENSEVPIIVTTKPDYMNQLVSLLSSEE